MTDEIGKDNHIEEFASGGPKCYAYLVQKSDGSTKETCKIKGIHLNYKNKKQLNRKVITEFMKGVRTGSEILTSDSIRRTRFHQVITRTETKTFKPSVLTKRRSDGQFGTLPYGHLVRYLIRHQFLHENIFWRKMYIKAVFFVK